MPDTSTAAIVVYQGVLADEAEAFRFVLSRVPGIRVVTVGTERGEVAGPGGVQTAEATLEEVEHPEVIVVPGGIGSHRRAEIASWLSRMSPTWWLASSTGSALLAAAGLLRGANAATHWLAGSLLETYGAHPSQQQVVIEGRIVTSSGGPSAFRAALVVAEAYGGPDLAARIKAEALRGREIPATPPRQGVWRLLRSLVRRQGTDAAPTSGTVRIAWAREDVEVVDLGIVTARHPPN